MDNFYNDSLVKELIKNNFNIKKDQISIKKKLTNNLNGILVVYAPWCETCMISIQMWNSLANLFKYKFNIYAVNAYNFDDNNQDLTLPLNVSIYPSYKFIKKDGKIMDFKSKVMESEIIKFIVKNID